MSDKPKATDWAASLRSWITGAEKHGGDDCYITLKRPEVEAIAASIEGTTGAESSQPEGREDTAPGPNRFYKEPESWLRSQIQLRNREIAEAYAVLEQDKHDPRLSWPTKEAARQHAVAMIDERTRLERALLYRLATRPF